MAIKSVTQLAEKNYRSVEEIQDEVDKVEEEVNDLGELLKNYETKFTKAAATTAATEFKIDVTPGKKSTPSGGGKPFEPIAKWQRVHIPKLDQLKANFSLVDELYDKLEILRTLSGTLKSNFKAKHGTGNVVRGIDRLRAVTEAKIANALRFLQNLAIKHVPEPFTDFVDASLKDLAKSITYTRYETFLYVYENTGGNFQFSAYIRLIDVQDDEGKVYPDLYLVFTCELKPQGRKEVDLGYYVTILHDYAVPGKFDIGQPVKSVKQALTVIGVILDLENFSNSLGVLPLPVSNNLKKSQFSVADKIDKLEVDTNSIEFILVKGLKDSKEIQKITEQLYVEIRAMLYRIKAKLNVRRYTQGGREVIKFTLSNLADSTQVSVNDLDFLRTMLGVDDGKLRQIVRVINGF